MRTTYAKCFKIPVFFFVRCWLFDGTGGFEWSLALSPLDSHLCPSAFAASHSTAKYLLINT